MCNVPLKQNDLEGEQGRTGLVSVPGGAAAAAGAGEAAGTPAVVQKTDRMKKIRYLTKMQFGYSVASL